MMKLENETDLPVSEGREFGLRKIVDITAIVNNIPAVGFAQGSQNL